MAKPGRKPKEPKPRKLRTTLRWRDEFGPKIAEMIARGHTNESIGKVFGVSRNVISRWIKQHPEVTEGAAPRATHRRSDYQPEYAAIARDMCAGVDGSAATDFDLAEAFGVSDRTIKNWRAKHPEFALACKLGKQAADDEIERSLFQRAKGYTVPVERVFCHNGQIVRAETTEHIPPDASAAFRWLNNRRPQDWRDRKEVTGAEGGPLQINVVKFAGSPLPEAHRPLSESLGEATEDGDGDPAA